LALVLECGDEIAAFRERGARELITQRPAHPTPIRFITFIPVDDYGDDYD